jgi:hypothetical protein
MSQRFGEIFLWIESMTLRRHFFRKARPAVSVSANEGRSLLLKHAFHVQGEEQGDHENDGIQDQVFDHPVFIDGPFLEPPSAPPAFGTPVRPDGEKGFNQLLRGVVRVGTVEREFSAFRADVGHFGFP